MVLHTNSKTIDPNKYKEKIFYFISSRRILSNSFSVITALYKAREVGFCSKANEVESKHSIKQLRANRKIKRMKTNLLIFCLFHCVVVILKNRIVSCI